MFNLIFQRRFEAAHRLIEGENAGTLCSQPHGHSWQVKVSLAQKTVSGLNGQSNVVVSFARAKGRWHQFIDENIDHGFFYNQRDPLLKFMLQENPNGRHIVVPGDPTTEMIAVLFMSKIRAILSQDSPGLVCESVLVHETPTNAVRFGGNPSDSLPQSSEFWWSRPDMSTR